MPPVGSTAALLDGGRTTSFVSLSASYAISAKNVQSAYQQSDVSYFTRRRAGELPTDTSQVIVLQYGSRNFKVGLAKDALPRTLPHVIAYRPGGGTGRDRRDGPIASPPLPRESVAISEEDLQTRLAHRYKTARKKPPPNIYTSLVSFNRSSAPQTISALNDAYGFEWSRPSMEASYVWGGTALHLNPAAGWKLCWPISRGHFNLHQGGYESYRHVTADLDRIWTGAIASELKVRRGDFPKYGLVIVVPDQIWPWELRALAELALKEMSFKAVAFLQESVSGTFGTGTSAALVLDMGAQVTKVACIEDGQVIRETQTSSPYGGDDLTVLLAEILRLHNFPYAECDLARQLDFELMDDLKIRLCTLDEDELASTVYEAYVRNPGQATRVYPFKIFEERIIVPSAILEEGVPLVAKVKGGEPLVADGEKKWYTGEHDSMDLYYTSKNTHASAVDGEEGPAAPPTNNGGDGPPPSETPASELLMDEDATAPSNTTPPLGTLVSIKEAVQKALDYLGDNPDRLKKFLSSILIMGNGLKFKGFVTHLQEWLAERLSGVEIDFVLEAPGSAAKENLTLDAGIVSWKGGAVFAKLECIADGYISQRDWDMCGARAFRERLLFACGSNNNNSSSSNN